MCDTPKVNVVVFFLLIDPSTVFISPLQCPLVDPRDVIRIIAIDRRVLAVRILLGPLQQPGVFDAVLRQARSVRYRAQREADLSGKYFFLKTITIIHILYKMQPDLKPHHLIMTANQLVK